MPGRKRTPEEIAERAVVAADFKHFRNQFKFTQKKLADIIGAGLCRRTIQMVEGGKVTLGKEATRKFYELKARHEQNKDR